MYINFDAVDDIKTDEAVLMMDHILSLFNLSGMSPSDISLHVYAYGIQCTVYLGESWAKHDFYFDNTFNDIEDSFKFLQKKCSYIVNNA